MPMGRRVRWVCSFAGAGLVAGSSGCLTPDPSGYTLPPSIESRYRPDPVAPPPGTSRGQIASGEVVPVSWQKAGTVPLPPPKKADAPRLDVPPGLPGSRAPLPALPPDDPENKAARLRAIDAMFPELAALGPDPQVDPAPGARAVTVDELIEHAKRTSPVIAQAAADVEEARGRWVQAGLYPNPTAGFQGDAMGNLGTAGQVGGFFTQEVVTGGKLRLARSVAHYDYANARLRLRKAEVELARQVRADHAAVLVAAETVRVTRLVGEFTEGVYRHQVALVRQGSAAPFEAAALRAVVGQSRLNLVQVRNRYVSAWKQLAATLNDPDMPPAPLAGRADEVAPRYRFDPLRDRLLAAHTDLAQARNAVARAEQAVALERRRPLPNVQTYVYFQNDTLVDSFQTGGQLGVELPVFDRNQGNVTAAVAQLARAAREGERVRNDLVRQLADAYERYETARAQLALYREQVLPDLVRAFRGVYERYETEPERVNYNDVVTAQQNLAARLGDYLQLLRQQGQAAADLAGLVQADRLEELGCDPDRAGPDTWPDTSPGK